MTTKDLNNNENNNKEEKLTAQQIQAEVDAFESIDPFKLTIMNSTERRAFLIKRKMAYEKQFLLYNGA